MRSEALLTTVGARVRALRDRLGLSRRTLSARSGVSERFLADLEAGRGNISLTRFAEVAAALGTSPADILAGASPSRGDTGAIALVGVRGAGKSTVGEKLAQRREVPFVEIDHRVEQAAGLTLAEIFALHGEAYYRRLEREVLTRTLAGQGTLVLATGGSIVNHRQSFALLRSRAHTVWLRARPEDHWNRVIQQGDSRPMAKNPHAFSELKALITAREPLYATCDHVVDTTGRTIDEVVDLIAHSLAP